MRFSSIKICNYRQYRNLEFDFPKTTGCDMHVIVASNGVGKTNLLNAVNWCLYGDEPHTSGGSSNSNDKMPLANYAALADCEAVGEKYCTVTVTIKAEDGDNRYVFERSANIDVLTKQQSGRDDFCINQMLPSGETKIIQFGQAEDLVSKYLPKKIRQYFYFDGEQLLYYFSPETEKISHIRDSIYEIAGVNTLRAVEGHLADKVKEYQRTINKGSPDLESKQTARDNLQASITDTEDEIKKLNLEIEQARLAIEEADQNLNGTEATVEKNRRYNANIDEIDRCEAQLKVAKKQRVAFIKKYVKLLFFYEDDKATMDYIAMREEADSVNAEVNVGAIKESLEKHECQLCKRHIPHDIEDELKKLVTKYEANVSLQKLAEIKSDVRRSLDVQDYQQEKDDCNKAINVCETRISTLQSENDELYSSIMAVASSMDQIETFIDQKKANQYILQSDSERLGSAKTQLEALKKKKEDADKEYEEAISKLNSIAELRSELEFTKEAEKIVTDTQKEIVDEVKHRMEEKTMELFSELIWKKDTYGHIELDDNFQLKLFDKRTGRSCLSSCSAAERELLALAFTIALHEVSGYNNLLFIDTPVGRISDDNRSSFAEVLLNVSKGKQIILAFTPSEYSSEISSVIGPGAISSYQELKLSDSEDETIVIKR